ncbi:Zn-ribbon domain-containing OB-fold protein [Cytobacillus gottheilii]|uniref:Zn-ribbon domain-containing OB-fold protein n=1 Tax=Cytobacillus gottheilii TaxID=859144 RepID=UPI0009EDEA8B|nr:OB-fold domain-containing protein [Cytobacillus gottheilii]
MANIQVFECTGCQKQFVQRKWLCPVCKGTSFKKAEEEGAGKVFSFTRIHVTSKEYAHLAPYTVVLIDTPSGLRITGRLSEEVQINDEVKCVEQDGDAYIFEKV